MAYLDNSGQDQSPSFLDQLARSLGLGGSQPAPNRSALASALAGQPVAPAGAHYARLPGPPLLLPGADNTASVQQPPAAAPGPAMPMRGSVADIPNSGAIQGPATIPAPPGPAVASIGIATPNTSAEENADTKVAQNTGASPAAAAPSAYEQSLKARFDQQKQIYDRADAQTAAAKTPEVARIYSQQAASAIAEMNRINDELSASRKPGTRTLSDAELTPAERTAGGEWQQSATGERSMVGGTAGDTTRAPNPEEQARLMAAGQDPKNYEVKDGALLRIPGTEPKADSRSFGIIGEDQFGNKQYGFTDKTTGEVTPYRPPAVPGGGADTADLHGKEFIDTLNPKIAGQVTAIVEGRAPYPTGMLLKTPYGQQLAAMVTQADPTFESGNATARVAARKEFESGGPNSVAGTITSGNAAIKHLGELSDDAESLGNRQIPIWNAVANAYETQTGDKRVTNFNNTIGRFGEEATKFYRGIGGSEADVQRDIANLSPNMSPEQLHGAIQKQANLMRDKIVAYQDRWHKTMGPMVPDFPIVDKSTQNVLNKLDTRAGGAPTMQGSEPVQPLNARNVSPDVTGAQPRKGVYIPGKGIQWQ